MTRRVLIAVAACAAFLASSVPAGAWTLTRSYTQSGSTVHGTGRLCTAAKFGTWSWTGRATTPAGVFVYRWQEPITRDGRAHHLRYTYVGGSAISSLPAAQRDLVIRTAIAQLNRSTVAYVERSGPDDAFLEYTVPGAGTTHVRFRPHTGC